MNDTCHVFEEAAETSTSTSSMFFFHGGEGEGLPAFLSFTVIDISIIIVAIIASALIVKKLVEDGKEKKSDTSEEGDTNEDDSTAAATFLPIDATSKQQEGEQQAQEEEEKEESPITGNKWKELEQNCMNVGTADNKKRIEDMLSSFSPSDKTTTRDPTVEEEDGEEEWDETEWEEHLNYKVELPECPICFLPFPGDVEGSVFMTCCGVEICEGCSVGRVRSVVLPKSPPISNTATRNRVTELDEFTTIVESDMSVDCCPFCRSETNNDKETSMRNYITRIEKHQDTMAMTLMGDHYRIASEDSFVTKICLPKAKSYYERAYELGDAEAAYKLGRVYHDEIERSTKLHMKKMKSKKKGKKEMRNRFEEENKKKMNIVKEYYTEAARRGSIDAETELADLAWISNQKKVSAKHSIRAARHGCESTMKNLFGFYKIGIISKKSLDETLRAHHNVLNEKKSESREYAKRYREFRYKYEKDTDEYGDWLPGRSPYDEVAGKK